jgi:hypothetical protein
MRLAGTAQADGGDLIAVNRLTAMMAAERLSGS